ncbi:MAG: methionyl-tRNA formyltransferase [Planctomycetales bacterium]|nr:methionyl-tRNA formyltransferase [Planctomycetales bacterium]
MKIVYFGSAQFGIPCLEAICKSRHALAGVFTQPARPAGRHRSQPTPTDVAAWCAKHGISCIEADDINAPAAAQKIAACKADLLVVIAFGQKVSQEVIGFHRCGAVNVHASLLPKYRGAAPIHWAIMNGETETGVSIITLADRMDAGLILDQDKIPIGPDDTGQTLHDRLAEIAVPVLMRTIEKIDAGTVQAAEQNESQVCKAPKLKKEHGYIDWDKPAETIVRQIRALWPWPGAQSVYVSVRTGKHCCVVISRAEALAAGGGRGLVAGALDDNLNVVCGKGMLKIAELKPAGSDRMTFDAFVNGRSCGKGDLFVSSDEALKGLFQ